YQNMPISSPLIPVFACSFPQSAYRVNLKEHQLSNPSPSLVSSPVHQILIHPDYNRGTRAADIALVQLAEPVRYTDEILPVCLPGPSDSFAENHMCWVTGWGRIDSEGKTIPRRRCYHSVTQGRGTSARCARCLGWVDAREPQPGSLSPSRACSE
uniref:Peptidase S1 domain-containing protein n=1 Tax=Gopherus agassizii TaxID=38772 RepID=A0A452GPP3_9SAUR